MTAQDLPPKAAPRTARGSGARKHDTVVRRRTHCCATFRFAGTPRLELVHLASRTAAGVTRWLRMGAPAGITALVLGLEDRKIANLNDTRPRDTRVGRKTFALELRSKTARTADERPHYQREVEPRHDTYGGIFADWPDPGGAE